MVAMGMYECYWCKKWTYKENWGPGWVRCPKCKMIAPSALEEQKLESVRTRGKRLLPSWDGTVGYRTGKDGHWFCPWPKSMWEESIADFLGSDK